MEKFESENADLKIRTLVARGKLPPSALPNGTATGTATGTGTATTPNANANANAPHPLGTTPSLPRSGGQISPSFYLLSRLSNPSRLPNSTYNFWQRHADQAPSATQLGLGVSCFDLPEGGNANDNEFEMPREGASASASASANKNTFANRNRNRSSPHPVETGMMNIESALTLNKTLSVPLGSGLYHDTTASLLASPHTTASLLPSLQPRGFSPSNSNSNSKPAQSQSQSQSQRIMAPQDALQWQGEMSPRSRLHNARMFPYDQNAHEAAYVVQRFWGRQQQKRLRATIKVSSRVGKRMQNVFVCFLQFPKLNSTITIHPPIQYNPQNKTKQNKIVPMPLPPPPNPSRIHKVRQRSSAREEGDRR